MISNVTLHGLDTLYSSHTGGPFKLQDAKMAESFRFNSMTVSGSKRICKCTKTYILLSFHQFPLRRSISMCPEISVQCTLKSHWDDNSTRPVIGDIRLGVGPTVWVPTTTIQQFRVVSEYFVTETPNSYIGVPTQD